MTCNSLGDRMKLYESVTQTRLVPKLPMLIRLDGKAFHTLTVGMDKPVDLRFQRCMWETARYLCERIQGCQLAYVQSDEITLLLVDYQTIQTQAWFDGEVQKMCSIAAGMASAAFSCFFHDAFPEWAGGPLPVFDCRVWNLPRHEVVNCFIWRQQDAVRNSIQGLAQAHFSHKQLHDKDQREMHDMLFVGKGINWNDCPTSQKRGACIVREVFEAPNTHEPGAPPVIRRRWVVDEEIPTFTQDRNYIQRFVDAPGEVRG